MTIKILTNDKTLQILNSYEDSLVEVLKQYNNEEDSILLKHMITNIHFIKSVLEIQSSANKFSWQIMTSITGVPQVLRQTSAHALQYDTEQNINKNFEQLYNSLILNNMAATENLQKHIDRNENIKIISGLLAVTSIVLSELIAPWSVWGVSFLLPLYSTLAVPLIIILLASIGIGILSTLHSYTLREMHHRHAFLEEHENQTPDQDGFLGRHKTNRFFQPGNQENSVFLLDRVKKSFDEKVAFEI